MLQHIYNVREKLFKEEKEPASLKILMHPYRSTMKDLVGPVHSCTENSISEVITKLGLDPTKSVLFECGCGAPFLGLQASIFALATICLDLPCVMKAIHWILSFLKEKDSCFARTIHWISGFEYSFFLFFIILLGDILEMRGDDFHEIAGILKEVTHVTAFIGLPDGINRTNLFSSFDIVNEALIRFALIEMPALQCICFRREVNEECRTLLEKFGFKVNPARSFMLTLRGSSKTSLFLTSNFFQR